MTCAHSIGVLLLTAALTATTASRCQAHFPWLATDDQGRAILFFGESPQDRDYKLPDAVAEAKVLAQGEGGKPVELKLEKIEEDNFVGRRSADAAASGSPLESVIQYGVYHGMLLDYYAKGLTAVAPGDWEKTAASKSLKLNPTPRMKADDLELVVQWEGKPLAGAAATMIDAAGEQTEAETNAEGVAAFKSPGEGLVGFLVNRTDDKAKGKMEDQEYTSAGQYATVTVQLKKSATAAASPNSSAAAVPALPEPLASFGGAVCDGWLYVYGGHIGKEHDHSRENLSAHFRRLKMDGGDKWEDLPMQTALQGLPLVAHGGKLYRVGGLDARNAPDSPDDLHSVAEFACFDPAANEWTALPALPEARSSHDAVVIGDVLYVVGGWKLEGKSPGTWLTTAWSFDLTDHAGAWKAVAAPPFKRRALAVAEWDGKLVALGGMDDAQKISKRADVLDLGTNAWSALPELPGKEMGGFGVSACGLNHQLLVSGADGVVHRLAADGGKWESVGKLSRARFFHRLLPENGGTLLAVAGASQEEGHLGDIERFTPTHD